MTYQEELNHFYDAINVDYATYVAGTLSQSGSNETLGFRTAGSPSEKSSGQFLYHQFQKSVYPMFAKKKSPSIPGNSRQAPFTTLIAKKDSINSPFAPTQRTVLKKT